MNADKDFARRVTLSPADVVAGFRVATTRDHFDHATETFSERECTIVVGYDYVADYQEGYAYGLKQDSAGADRHILFLAMGIYDRAGGPLTNSPNNLLYGYIHGKHRRETGKDCLAAECFAAKCGHSDHFPKPIVKELPKGRAIRSEKHEKWVVMRNLIDPQQLTWATPSTGKTLGEVAGAALREILASK